MKMNRFIKGLSYSFQRNIGGMDRTIRTVIAVTVLLAWSLGIIQGTFAFTLSILVVMILATAVTSRCGVTYWLNANTMTEAEKRKLDEKNISYE